jgi:hypothetical protein
MDENDPNDRASFAKRITETWQSRGIAAIMETGDWLIKARDRLDHGDYEAMVKSDLPFERTKAYRLRVVAAHPVLSNVAHAQHLPADFTTLCVLDSRLSDDDIEARIKDGTINPKLRRKDAIRLFPAKTKTPKFDKDDYEGDVVALRIIDEIDAYEAAIETLDEILLLRDEYELDDEMLRAVETAHEKVSASLESLREIEHEADDPKVAAALGQRQRAPGRD